VIEGKCYKILLLVHPRQAGKSGAHSGKWAALHENWILPLFSVFRFSAFRFARDFCHLTI